MRIRTIPQLGEVLVEDDSLAGPALRDLLGRDPDAAVRSLGLSPPDDVTTQAPVEVAGILSAIWQGGPAIPRRDLRIDGHDDPIGPDASRLAPESPLHASKIDISMS